MAARVLGIWEYLYLLLLISIVIIINGIDHNDRHGISVTNAGDINKDGKNDVIISCRNQILCNFWPNYSFAYFWAFNIEWN
ncbi:MAG: integrin alpha [Candidatus Midichloria sp.]